MAKVQPRKEKIECDHKGHYGSVGLAPVPTPSGLILLAVLYCKKCGAMMIKDSKLGGIRTRSQGVPVPSDMLSKIHRV